MRALVSAFFRPVFIGRNRSDIFAARPLSSDDFNIFQPVSAILRSNSGPEGPFALTTGHSFSQIGKEF